MAEYTYADVIIDPEDPRVEIGAEYYFADNPRIVLLLPEDHKTIPKKLTEVSPNDSFPFLTADGLGWACLIRKEELSYVERQAEWVKEVGLKSGDEVRILRKFEPNEGGFYYRMNSDGDMDPLVGKVLTVKDVVDDMIRVYNEDKTVTWVWPYFVLEKVWDAPRPMYTKDDIISDPFDKRVLAALGEEVYRGDNQEELLKAANDGAEIEMGILCEARIASDGYPFRIGLNWRYIILPKRFPEGKPGEQANDKPEKEYVPFDLSNEEDRDALRGKWIRDARWGNEWMIVGFFFDRTGGGCWKAKLSRREAGFSGSELLERFTFLDGSLCGRPANGQQMASK